jgi:hypothetical protein
MLNRSYVGRVSRGNKTLVLAASALLLINTAAWACSYCAIAPYSPSTTETCADVPQCKTTTMERYCNTLSGQMVNVICTQDRTGTQTGQQFADCTDGTGCGPAA